MKVHSDRLVHSDKLIIVPCEEISDWRIIQRAEHDGHEWEEYEEVVPNSPSGHRHVGRRLGKTFKQFERLRFLRRVDDRWRPLDEDGGCR